MGASYMRKTGLFLVKITNATPKSFAPAGQRRKLWVIAWAEIAEHRRVFLPNLSGELPLRELLLLEHLGKPEFHHLAKLESS